MRGWIESVIQSEKEARRFVGPRNQFERQKKRNDSEGLGSGF